mgnify:CR=1 FL=1
MEDKKEELDNYEYRGIIFENSKEEFTTIKKASTVTEILPTDNIYFTKASSYPRHKLRTYTDNTRVIKIEKADKIIIPKMSFSVSELTGLRDEDGKLFICDTSRI